MFVMSPNSSWTQSRLVRRQTCGRNVSNQVWSSFPWSTGSSRATSSRARGEGVVAYGPYATLSPGQHRIIAYGALDGPAEGAWLRVTASGGGIVLGDVIPD